MSGEVTKERLIKLQDEHLVFLERWTSRFPLVCGVPIAKCMNYMTLQRMNNIGLEALLEEREKVTTDG
jgi:hypothetical protein